MKINFSNIPDIYERILECNYYYILVIDKNYNYVYLNRTQPTLKKSDFIGKNCLEGLCCKDSARLQKLYDKVFHEKNGATTRAKAITDNKGSIGWYEISIAPLIIDSEPIEYLVITSRDITEKVALEQKLKSVKSKLERLVKTQKRELQSQKIMVAKKNQALESLNNNSELLNILTNREKEVFEFVTKGYTSKEIANRLNISIKTVSNHRENINKKISKKKKLIN